MAANTFDVSKVGNSTQLTIGNGSALCFFNVPVEYHFSTDGLTFFLRLNDRYYDTSFDSLTLGGAAPTDVAGALTTLSTLFP